MQGSVKHLTIQTQHGFKNAFGFKNTGREGINDLIAYLRTIDGVDNVNIVNATSSHWDSVELGYSSFAPINVKTIPMSGYFEIVDFTTLSYVV